ncbi:hypothetical protein MsAg5_05570 [Methanosarcinaceae archaeon Ag5]|uniref:Immunoglobulin domain-containing protein n=1 Tax=Methanolapillus africanus TaxID=3028297 RepID=A0AAE4MIZ9_9EURY|nr:hypothetical protein [Methanosarcinaceae archaeon Ag5]
MIQKSIYKRLFIVILTLALLLSMVPGTALGATVDQHPANAEILVSGTATFIAKGNTTTGLWVDLGTGFYWQYKLNEGSWTNVSNNRENGTYTKEGATIKISTTGGNNERTSTLTISNVPKTWDGAQLRARIGGDETDTGPATLTVYNKAEILTDLGTPTYAFDGTKVVLSVTPETATGMTYQWYKNGTAIPDATARVYEFTANKTTDNSATYYVKIIGEGDAKVTGGNNVTSATTTLTVMDRPSIEVKINGISTSTRPVRALENSEVNFTVVDAPGATYQWKKDGSDISGITAISHTISQVNLTDDTGTYSVVVTANGKSIEIGPVALEVYQAALINRDDTIQNYVVFEGIGNDITMTVAADNVQNYVWSKDGNVIPNGPTETELVITNATAADDGIYFVLAQGAGSTYDTIALTLTVLEQPTVTPDEIGEDGNATFVVKTVKGVEISNTEYTIVWNNLTEPSVSTANPFELTDAVTGDSGNYYVKVTNSDGIFTESDPVLLTVHEKPVITEQPINTIAFDGTEARFEVTLDDTVVVATPFTYQWFESTDGGINYVEITGADESLLEFLATEDKAANMYYVQITGQGVGNVIESNEVTLTVIPEPTVTPEEALTGETVTFATEDNGSWTYQWQKENRHGSFIDIVGATGYEYTIDPVRLNSAGSYCVIVTDTVNGSSAISDPLTLDVNRAAIIKTNPINAVAFDGQPDSVTFSAEARRDDTGYFTYQWYKGSVDVTNTLVDNSTISGATTKDLTISGITRAERGTYIVVVTGPYDTRDDNKATASARLVVLDQPYADPSDTVQEGTEVWFFTGYRANLNYEWQKWNATTSDYEAVGASSDYGILSAALSHGGEYRVVVTNQRGASATSDPITLTVNRNSPSGSGGIGGATIIPMSGPAPEPTVTTPEPTPEPTPDVTDTGEGFEQPASIPWMWWIIATAAIALISAGVGFKVGRDGKK